MKKAKFTEHQIISILKQQETGMKVTDICREHGISVATFYNWKAMKRGMNAGLLSRYQALVVENSILKRMFAELSLINQTLKDEVGKKQ